MTRWSTDDELDAMAKMIFTGPGRRTIAGVDKHIAQLADTSLIQVRAGIIRILIEELRIADLLSAKVAIELIEARKRMRQ